MTGQLARNLEALRQCAAEGLSIESSAARLLLKIGTVYNYSRQAKIALAWADTDPPPTPAYLERMREIAGKGRTRTQAAEELGVSYQMIGIHARRHGVKFRHGHSALSDPRSETMAVMYRNGYTLKAIGDQYGITRERVRQIITRRHGLSAKHGGDHVRAARASEKRKALKDARHLAKHGMTHGDYLGLRLIGREMRASGKGYYRSPLGAFKSQRRNAKVREIGWELSLAQWWAIWRASGKWDLRGRGQGYVMCRNGDEGPYAAGNVYIAPARQNTADSKSKKSGLPLGVRSAKRSKGFDAHRQISGVKFVERGLPTPELAHAAYLAFGAEPQRFAA